MLDGPARPFLAATTAFAAASFSYSFAPGRSRWSGVLRAAGLTPIEEGDRTTSTAAKRSSKKKKPAAARADGETEAEDTDPGAEPAGDTADPG